MTRQTAKKDGYEKAPSMGAPLEWLACTSPQSPCCGCAVVITKSTVVTLLRFTGTRVHLILQQKKQRKAPSTSLTPHPFQAKGQREPYPHCVSLRGNR